MVQNIGNIDKSKINEMIEESKRVYFKSNFCFLNQHNGLRLGAIHVFLGTSGSGKTTFTRSVIGDCARLNPDTIFMWQSEECVDELAVGLHQGNYGDEALGKILGESEQDEPNLTEDDFLERVIMTGAKILIIDNITTSRFYADLKPSAQADFIQKLKTFAFENNIAVIMIAHTRKQLSDNANQLITEADIKGSSTITNLANFFYILQRFQHENLFFATLRIVKHRGQVVDEKFYLLEYERETQSYKKDRQIPFADIEGFMKQQNKAGTGKR